MPRSTPRRDHGPLGVRAVYTVRQLARAASMTHQSLDRLLVANGVRYLTSDPRRVTWSELCRCLPDLAASIAEVQARRAP